MKSPLALAVLMVALAATAPARGADAAWPGTNDAAGRSSATDDDRDTGRRSDAAGWREPIARLEVGYRGVFVTDAGYNPFSSRDYFSGFALAVSRTVATDGRLAFAAGLAWDYGSSSAPARAASASLAVHRFTLPLEGRLLVASRRRSWGYGFVRAAPGVAVVRAELDDSSAPALLAKSLGAFTVDASAGYAFPLLPFPARPGRALRMWFQADAGYSYVADDRLELVSHATGGGSVDLGTLRLRGAFLRVAVAASF